MLRPLCITVEHEELTFNIFSQPKTKKSQNIPKNYIFPELADELCQVNFFFSFPRDDISSLRMNKQHETGRVRSSQPAAQARSSIDSWIDLFLHSYFIRDDSLQSDENWWNVVKVQKRRNFALPSYFVLSTHSLASFLGDSWFLSAYFDNMRTYFRSIIGRRSSARENVHQKINAGIDINIRCSPFTRSTDNHRNHRSTFISCRSEIQIKLISIATVARNFPREIHECRKMGDFI